MYAYGSFPPAEDAWCAAAPGAAVRLWLWQGPGIRANQRCGERFVGSSSKERPPMPALQGNHSCGAQMLCKFCDVLPRARMSVCRIYYASPYCVQGTFAYMAPEVMNNHQSSRRSSYDARASDLWSCGVVLYAMLMGQYPFPQELHQLPAALQAMACQNFKLPGRLSPGCRLVIGLAFSQTKGP